MVSIGRRHLCGVPLIGGELGQEIGQGLAFQLQLGRELERSLEPGLVVAQPRLVLASAPLLRPGKPARHAIGEVGGFTLTAVREERGLIRSRTVRLLLQRTRLEQDIELGEATTPLGLIARLEHVLNGIEAELAQQQKHRCENEHRLRDYETRLDRPFELAAELELKRQALADLLAELAADQRDAA